MMNFVMSTTQSAGHADIAGSRVAENITVTTDTNASSAGVARSCVPHNLVSLPFTHLQAKAFISTETKHAINTVNCYLLV